MDFTLISYSSLIKNLLKAGYEFVPFNKFVISKEGKTICLRHDVDLLPTNSLRTAEIENKLGIQGTYYFRIVPESFHPEIIKAIASLKHEIGYHYEDMDLASKAVNNSLDIEKKAIEMFQSHLEKLRQIVPVNTICMHGSPRSKWDNKQLWKHYDYRQYGIIGEPYFDINFNEVYYLTDTGRRWDGESVSVRDKVNSSFGLRFRKTDQIIRAAGQGILPEKIMITVHPQRWSDNYFRWAKELMLQNVKNVVKRLFFVKKSVA